jgi:AcrR family transcriptional regulator
MSGGHYNVNDRGLIMDLTAETVKRRDAGRTREAILRAAQAAFATHGYGHAGIREIAAAAGIDGALVRRYFGSKEGLFEAALDDALDIDQLIDTDRAAFGRHLIDVLLEDVNDRPNALAMMMLAIADPVAREVTRDLVQRRVIEPLGRWLGRPDGEARAARIAMLLSGFLTFWKLLPLSSLADCLDPQTRRWMEQTLQDAIA